MGPSVRVALSGFLSTIILASCPYAAVAGKQDNPAAIAGDEAAFNQLRADIRRRNTSQDAVQANRRKLPQEGGCQIKPVMTDKDMAACKRR